MALPAPESTHCHGQCREVDFHQTLNEVKKKRKKEIVVGFYKIKFVPFKSSFEMF